MKKTKELKVMVILFLIIALTTIGILVSAGNDVKYLLTVIDNGASHAKADDVITIHRQIASSTATEMSFETKIKNDTNARREVSILMDTSESINENLEAMNIYTEVQNFVGGLYDNIANMNVSISNNQTSKAMTNSKTTAVGYINSTNFPMGQGRDLNAGLTKAYSTFTTTANTEKYMVIFTDATDEVKQSLQNLEGYGINVVSILIDLTSDSYINADGTNVTGTIKRIASDGTETSDYTTIYNEIEKSVTNLVFEDRLSQKAIDYFDLELDPECINDNDIKLIIENGKIVGVKAEMDEFIAQQTKTIKYKLKFKSNINNVIDVADVWGNPIGTNTKLKATYTYEEQDKTLETENTPTIQIGKGFKVTIIAVNENSKDIRVGGIDFEVTVTDEDGNVLVDHQTYTSSSTGKIEIEDLVTTKKVKFDIVPTVNKAGYETTSPGEFEVIYNPLTRGRELSTNDYDWEEETVKSNVNVYFPIEVTKFDLEVKLEDADNSSVILRDSQFELLQPKLNNTSELTAVKGKTDGTSTVHFSLAVMTQDGDYEYVLTQQTAPNGYEGVGSTKIRISFKDGKVTGIKILNNTENVKENGYTDNQAKVLVTNKPKTAETFTLIINNIDKDTLKGIFGTEYKVTVDSVEYNNVRTDSNGNLRLTVNGARWTYVEIVEINPNPAYVADTGTKSLIIYRDQGTVQNVTYTNPTTLTHTFSSGKNEVEVTLESERKSEQNVVRVHVSEKNDPKISLRGVTVELVESTDGTIYTEKTMNNGLCDFILPSRSAGTYTYLIKIPTVPNGYLYPTIGSIDVTFDANGKIVNTSVPAVIDPVMDIEALNEAVATSTNTGWYVELGLDFNDANAKNFTIRLKANNTAATPISGAVYDVTITMVMPNGEIAEKFLTNVKTDSDGLITTKLLDCDSIEIEVKEIETIQGFKIDTSVQMIYLIKDASGNFILDPANMETPHNAAEGKGMGTSIVGDDIIFDHKNDPKTLEDLYLDLHIVKKDTNGGFLQGIGLWIEEPTDNNAHLGLWNVTENASLSTHPIKTATDNLGEVDLLRLIKAKDLNTETSDINASGLIDTEYTFSVWEYDIASDTKIAGSESRYRIVYRYNPVNGDIKLTNIDIRRGKKLEADPPEYTTSESPYGYESRVGLFLYSYEGQIGNFILDLQKYSPFDEDLNGARYKIEVIRPNGSILKYEKEVTNSDIECEGFFVSKGTKIEITEIKAPTGYAVNQYTEVIEITDVDETTGMITVKYQGSSYSVPRLEITKDNDILLDDGSFQKELQLKLIDYELDIFKMGIIARDSECLAPVKDYNFKVTTSKGAQVNSGLTNSSGKVNFKVGGYYKDEGPIIYTITTAAAAPYFKPLQTPIQLHVYFDLNGKVDVAQTMANQVDAGYGTTWEIVGTNTVNGNDIDIRLIVDPYEKLTVNVETIDELTGNVITGITYKIPESVNITAQGQTQLLVGYVNPNSVQTYTLQTIDVTNATYKYNVTPNQQFQITYDSNGDIAGTPVSLSNELTVVSASGKTINIRVIAKPQVTFAFTNLKFNTTDPLQGATFEVTEVNTTDSGRGTTNADGKAAVYTSSYGESVSKKYLVKQLTAKVGFAKVEDFYIRVDFDNNKTITNVTLVDVNDNPIANSNNLCVNVGFEIGTSSSFAWNGNTKGIVTIEVFNYPALTFKITNVDRRDGTTPLAGTEYAITSTINTGDVTTTNSNGLATAYLDKTVPGGEATYTIRQTIASNGYQSIEEMRVKVYFDNEGYVSTTTPVEFIKIVNGVETITTLNYAEVASIPAASRTTLEDQFTVNLTVKNNPLLKFVINKKDTTETDILNGVKFEISGTEKDQTEVLTRDSGITGGAGVNGQLILKLDNTIDNKTCVYTLKETAKTPGYKWLAEDVKVELTYDSTGKMVAGDWRVIQGDQILKINPSSSDVDNFILDVTVLNEEIEEFGIHMVVEDRYDSSKKLERDDGYKVEMKLHDISGDSTQRADDTKMFIAGRDDNGDSIPDIAHGEDYQSFGQQNGRSYFRVLITPQNTPNKYYQGVNTTYTTYQTIEYTMEIQVSLDDEGRIASASIYRDSPYDADSQWISIDYTPGKYKLKLTIHYFPMLQIGINAVDEYTKEHLDTGNFEVSTTYGNNIGGTEYQKQNVKAGWVGIAYSYGHYNDVKSIYGKTYSFNVASTTNDMPTNKALCPIENEGNATMFTDDGEVVRRIYVYENNEPNTNTIQYQQYEPRYNTGLDARNRRLLAMIDVYYSADGEIVNTDIHKLNIADPNGTDSPAQVVIKAQKQFDNPHSLVIDVQYKPTTTFKVNVIDEVSRKPIDSVRISPFLNQNSVLTARSYEYRTTPYYDVDSDGKVTWTYWGGNPADEDTNYIWGTSFQGSSNKGYVVPGNIDLLVSYDENGRVDAVDVRSANQFGRTNAELVKIDKTTVEINIICSRKFNMELRKLDKYNHSETLSSSFKVVSIKGVTQNVNSSTSTTVGMIYPGELVRYTISETIVPNGYLPIETFDLDVQFNDDGTIRYSKISSSTNPKVLEQYEQISVAAQTDIVDGYKLVDLVANIYDKPSFTMQVKVTDEFYPTLPVVGAQFEITNDKGDTTQGTPITDNNGYFETYVGEAYPGETVTYTIKQVNTVSGYHTNTNIAKIEVKFKTDGNIEKYTILSPAPYNYSVNNTAYINKKYLKVDITNMPKDVKLGINKFDGLTKEPIEGVEFKVTKEYTSGTNTEYQYVTGADGKQVNVVDEFLKRNDPIYVKYTISEITVPNTYRKIQDVVLQVRYETDGRIGSYMVVSNPSSIGIDVAIASQIKYTGNKPVHIALNIPNDNTYDLIVKDEDSEDASGLGIQGTKYDVTINGHVLPDQATDVNGYARYLNNTENGRIVISVAERANGIGEGYRQNLLNKITFVLNKGELVYSLALDVTELTNMGYTLLNTTTNSVTGAITYEIQVDSTGTIVELVVCEQYGTVNVKFKNATKLELTLLKKDIDTNQLLSGAQFEITEEVISPIPSTTPKVITTVGVDDTTGADGKLYFDLGSTHRQEVVKYTFTETTMAINPATGDPYGQILPIEVEVTFDQYGRINPNTGMVEQSPRTDCYMETQTGLSRSMFVEIANGALNQAFKVKIISEDSQTGNRIKESKFNILVKELTNGNTLYETAPQPAETKNGVFTTKTIGKDYEGDIEIQIDQVALTQQEIIEKGYIFGNNPTSGKIVINKENIDTGTSTTANIQLTLKSITGFNIADVVVDNPNREIKVTIKNDPQLIMDLTKTYKNRKGEIQGLENVKFEITAMILDTTGLVDAGISITTPATDTAGHALIYAGLTYAGKDVIYTIKEIPMDGFKTLDDIQIMVSYDQYGEVKTYKLLTSDIFVKIPDIQEITNSKNARYVELAVQNQLTPNESPYHLEIHKVLAGTYELNDTSKEEDEGVSTEAPNNGSINLNENLTDLLPGARYEIKIVEENGITYTWEQVTDTNGKIITRDFNGNGEIHIYLTEIEAPEGYKLDSATKEIILVRDIVTGEFTVKLNEVYMEINADQDTIYIAPENEPETFTLYLHTVNKNTMYRIQNNPVDFDVILKEGAVKKVIASGTTDNKGTLRLENIEKPQEPGTYTYIIKEKSTPKGFLQNTAELEFNVTFIRNADGELVIDTINNGVTVISTDWLQVQKYGEKYIRMNVLFDSNGAYTLILEKHTQIDEDDSLLPGATFEITVTEENGETRSWEATTDANGRIISNAFYGYGYIKVELVEKTAPKGFKLDLTKRYFEVYKNEDTGIFTTHGGNVEVHFSEDQKSILYVKPRDEIENNKYTITLNKVDKMTKNRILSNPAKFELYIENEGIKELIGTATTVDNGTTRFNDLSMPAVAGTYTVYLKEIETPDGYKELDRELELEITFTATESGELEITKIETKDELLYKVKNGTNYAVLNVYNVPDYLEIEVTKIDAKTKEPILNIPTVPSDPTTAISIINDNAAIFRLTTESGEEVFFTTDADGKIIVPIGDIPGEIPEGESYVEVTYILNEIMAPTGYILNKGDIEITLRYIEDENGAIVLDGDNIVVNAKGENVEDVVFEDTKLKFNVTNEEGSLIGDYDTGNYSIILTKRDAETKEIISGIAEFTISLENGQRDLAKTKLDGKIEILDIKAPKEPGTYEYVIAETLAPEGYTINVNPEILKITFETDPNDNTKLVVTNAEPVLDANGNSQIKVTSYANNTVEFDFENQKDMETLYLKSDKDNIGDDIYNVFQKEDVPYVSYNNAAAQKLGKTYTFNNPTIYTKEPLAKATAKKMGITIEEFINNLDTNAEKITIYDEDGTEVAVVNMDGNGNITSINMSKTGKTASLMKTGQTLKAEKGTQELTYDVIVKGDINGDGMMTTADSTKMKQILANSKNYGDKEKAAGDVDTQGLVTTADSTKIKGILAGTM